LTTAQPPAAPTQSGGRHHPPVIPQVGANGLLTYGRREVTSDATGNFAHDAVTGAVATAANATAQATQVSAAKALKRSAAHHALLGLAASVATGFGFALFA